MTLSKGFLRERFIVQRVSLVSGILLWILCSYILYAFFYCFREVFRILTVDLGLQPLLVLNIKETFLYNLFYSALATSLGYMFALRFILSYSITGQSARKRSLIKRTVNDADFFSWSFLFWFGKFLSTLGIIYISFPLQYDIAFLKEFPLLLVLIPLVVFFSTWPRLIRVVGIDKYKYLGISLGVFLLLSFGFAFKNFTDTQAINHALLKSKVEYSYTLNVPRSQSFLVVNAQKPNTFISPSGFAIIDIYVVNDSLTNSQPLIFFGDVYSKIDLGEVYEKVKIERERLEEVPGSPIAVNLHIDKDIKLGFINQLNYQIRKADQRRILYSTVPKYSKYPANYPTFKNSGIRYNLREYYPEFEAFLDSAEKVDLSKYSFRIPDSPMYRVIDIKKYNRIELIVDQYETSLNGKIIAPEKLKEIVYLFIKKYAPDYVIIFNPAPQVTYNCYIENLDLIYSQIDRLKNEMSISSYNTPYEDWHSWDEQKDNIDSKYPTYIVEWTVEEKRLIELMKKANIY